MSEKEIKMKPRVGKSKYPTLTGNPQLGYLNECHCPRCGRLLFAYYDTDIGRGWAISKEWNYCSQCGQRLDLDDYPKQEPKLI